MGDKTPRFGLLGPLQMSVGGKAVPVGTPKQRVVLAVLLLNRNRSVAVESLIDAAWGEDAPAEARASVHVYVSNLRRLLGTGGVVDPRKVLQKAPPGYRLNVSDGDVDLGRFVHEKAVGVQAASDGNFEQATRHFSAALGEWRGAFLEDLREIELIDAFAVALVEDKVAVHISRAQAEMACGRAESVVSELETLVVDHPYREPVWAELMTAYYLADRQSDALGTFQRLKAILANELGIDPSPAVRALHERILRQETFDIQRSVRVTATETLIGTRSTVLGRNSAAGLLRTPSGECYALNGAATRIGRLSDNDIVLADAKVSRHHAVIIDTGTSFVINDAGSANGVELGHERIRGSAPLVDGDSIRIGDSRFVFELHANED
ncbi:BTAD domain-containing putative transcriptional regulator [Mycobacterium sp. 1423905.2]|uniref:BTAD domain-containing putative transcriptional regulator n=1 Tax=Mycobacterium sp. 1423905.2 TaxID=1856859 RepID=UPI0007FCE30B|nr:BTAD domain-containing putative transcriptional regulator [Mycobacterium sp. 1423905.2]OBJ59531.1 regulator [Mycobacterium sp. 1423905.2]